jgi:phosphatidylglycerophosphatase A
MTTATDGPATIPASNTKPKISILLASWFGCGFLPKAPGTAGSLGGVCVSVLTIWIASLVSRQDIHIEDHYWTFGHLPTHAMLLMTLLISAIGVITADRAARFAQLKDPQWVVIDEVSGQMITYHLFFWITPINWKTLLLGFVLFRVFDIWKPAPVRQLEKLPGGWGIMADDWMAAVYAAILLQVALHFRVI